MCVSVNSKQDFIDIDYGKKIIYYREINDLKYETILVKGKRGRITATYKYFTIQYKSANSNKNEKIRMLVCHSKEGMLLESMTYAEKTNSELFAKFYEEITKNYDHHKSNDGQYATQSQNMYSGGSVNENYPPGYVPKSWTVTLVLLIFLGLFGAHRFYVGKVLTGILVLLTFGGFGVWWLIDLILICTNKFTDKQGYVLKK